MHNVGRCSYIGNDGAITAVCDMLRDAVGKDGKSDNAVAECVLSEIHKEHFEFMRKLCSDNITLEKFGTLVMVDAKFTSELSLNPFELQRIYDIIKTGSDSFSITNSGNNERSFSISYSFTVQEGADDNE